jgi:hypothetical protein
MKNKKSLYIIIVVLVLIVIGGLLVISNKGERKENTLPSNTEQTVGNNQPVFDCGLAKDPSCFINKMTDCSPVTIKMMSSDNKASFDLTILGIENQTCHFQRKVNDVTDLNCFSPKGIMNWNTIDQTFGNEKGLQKVVDDACKKGW